MAAKTASILEAGQGVVKVFHFTDIDDADTFTGPASPKAYWVTNKTDGVVVSVTESAGVYTFTVASGGTNKVVDLFILQ